MQAAVDFLNSIIWSPVLVYFLLCAGLLYSVITRFVQVRLFKEMISLMFRNKGSDQGISAFQALAVSLSGRVGTGNIAGVAAAIGFGGPGAVFWMWMVAFLGAATAYVEATLAQIYKEEQDGEYRGGPAYYIEKAMGQKWYAWVFAIASVVAYGLLLPSTQSNNISNAMEVAVGSGAVYETFLGTLSLTKIITGTVMLLMLGFIIFGGVKRIAKFAQAAVPFMALAYILMACIIVFANIDQLPGIISMIVQDAFTPMAGAGAAIGWGVKRGVYSNEAGQGGIGPHAAAAAEVQHPAQQGLVQAFSVYIDTLFVCSATAFMILITGAYNVHHIDGGFLIQNVSVETVANSPAFTQMALEQVVPGLGKPFIAIALFFFAFTTILAYYYVAETNIVYMRRALKVPGGMRLIKFAVMASTFYGVIKVADIAWGLGDIGVGMMAWLNTVGIVIIFFMSRPAIKALKDYEQQKKSGVTQYTFDPKKLGIKNADFWVSRKTK